MLQASQARCRGFDPRLPLHSFSLVNSGIPAVSGATGASGSLPQTCLKILRRYLGAILGASFLLMPAHAEAQRAGLAIPASVFVTLQAADVHSTHQAITSGRGIEANPLMQFSTGEQAAIKAGVTVGVVYLMTKLHARKPKTAKAALWIMNGVMTAVVVQNYRIARR